MILFSVFSLIILAVISIYSHLGKLAMLMLIIFFGGGTDIAARVINIQIENSKLQAQKYQEILAFKHQFNHLNKKTNKGTKWVNIGGAEAAIVASNKKCILYVKKDVNNELYTSFQCLTPILNSTSILPIAFEGEKTNRSLVADISPYTHVGDALLISSKTKENYISKFKDMFSYTFNDFMDELKTRDILYVNNEISFNLKNSQTAISQIRSL